MNKNKKLFKIVIITVTIALGFLIYITIKQNRRIIQLQGAMPNLLEGDTIDYFDVVGTNNQRLNALELNNGKPKLIFIPKQPCLSCSTNTSFWRRIAKVLGNEVDIYGVWLGNSTEMFDYQEKARLGFIFFAPVDVELFKQRLKLKFNYAQTILYIDNKIAFIRLDTLDGEDFTAILRMVKTVLNKNKTG